MENNGNFHDLNQEKENLLNVEAEWLESLEDLRGAKSEIINHDLFSILEYLKSCDVFFKNSSLELKELNVKLQKISEYKLQNKENDLTSIDELINGIKHLKLSVENKLNNLDVEYLNLSEETLRKVQDKIAKFTIKNSNSASLKSELDQGLDKKLFLQELKDSLEDYRQAREDYVSESMEEEPRLQDNLIPEDLAMEAPESDQILSQLDTVITECDAALLISEISETE
ncbi:MAG: hypothetical protein H0V82_10115 [Candidatus Protochlamydia sp.]|nr:hypothetical protein [Candidatus Protochlamydia sp.]